MVMRKLGLSAFLILSLAGVADAKYLAKHSHHPAQAAEHGGGVASVYASNRDGYAGGRAASGERVHSSALTAAHRSLPFGTMVRVTNRRNNKSVVVRINDRGPFVRGRVIDLTPAGARAIGMSGLAPVSLSVVSRT